MHVVKLTRDEYLDSVQNIADFPSLKFSKQALDGWDDYFSWKYFPPLCLVENDEHLCYLFYHVSKDNEYLTIHNLLTPKIHRNSGFAHLLLEHLFTQLASEHIKRFKFYCVFSSLAFYNSLGLNYWGVNRRGLYYCDFKMPLIGMNEIPKIVRLATIEEFSVEKLDKMYEQLKENGEAFTEKENDIHQNALNRMGKRYIFDTLEEKINREEVKNG